VPERAIDALVRFARVVSDASGAADVLDLLADALFAHVCPEGLAVFSLGASGTLSLAAERGLGEAVAIAVDADDLDLLSERVRRALPATTAPCVTRPLVAGGSLFGAVIMFGSEKLPTIKVSLADGLIDLAAIALGTAEHVTKLERQFAELRAHQEVLARTEKLRALGQMAAGISHDLKNILNPLSLHIQVISRSLDRGKIDDAKSSAVEMKQVLQRGVQTLDRLRSFSREEKGIDSELVDLDSLAREAVAIGKSRSASGSGRVVKIVEQLEGPPPVTAASSEVVSALVNLVVNAIDAGARTITLRSGERDRGSWIEVADDGPGMPPEVANRVFEPFFTTKGAEGTGLGLAMLYASVERHGGTVTLDPAPGKGTTFCLWFPHSAPRSGSPGSRRQEP
jgi:signal transduction histidine kinase